MQKNNPAVRYLALVPKEPQSTTAARIGVHASTVSRWRKAIRKGREPSVRAETQIALEVAIRRMTDGRYTGFERGVRYALDRLREGIDALESELKL